MYSNKLLWTCARLYLATEIAEECASVTRFWLRNLNYVVILTYLILALDGLPLLNVAIGIGTHASYILLFRSFPVVDLISTPPILCFTATLINHFGWFKVLLQPEYLLGQGLSSVIGFFLVLVWLVPIGFFISLTDTGECLPSTSPIGYHSSNESFSFGEVHKKKKGLLKTFLDNFLERVTHIFPGWRKSHWCQLNLEINISDNFSFGNDLASLKNRFSF